MSTLSVVLAALIDPQVVTDNNELVRQLTSSSLLGGESKHVFLFLYAAQGKVQIDLLFSASKTAEVKISKFVGRAILHVCPIRDRFRARVSLIRR